MSHLLNKNIKNIPPAPFKGGDAMVSIDEH